jgi:FkbM family methyltransferase
LGRFSFNRRHIGAQLALRLWPFPRGSGRLTDRLFSRLSFGSEKFSIITSDGFPMLVQPSDLIGRHLYLTGEFDRSTFEVLHDFSQPGDTLLDIGANIGYVSSCFLWNDPQSSVVAVDPQPGVIELLRENLSRYEEHRYKVFQVAVSDRDGVGMMEICNNNRGASRLTNSSGESSVQVNVWSFSRLIAEAKIEKVNLIKLDVEGNEENIVSAMAPILDRIRPRAIVFEEHGDKSAPDGTIGRLLGCAGYRIFGIRKKLLKLELVPIHDPSNCTTNDYIAVHESTLVPNRALRKYSILRTIA